MAEKNDFAALDAQHYQMKLKVLHEGPCSSPRNNPGDTECTCPRECPLHGRCCDCIKHHKEERLGSVAKSQQVKHDYNWIPHCLRFFDARHGIGMEKDPDAGKILFGMPGWTPPGDKKE